MGSHPPRNNDINEDNAISETDTDEENDVEQGVVLGFLEKTEKDWSLPEEQFASKAGGVPVWMDPINLPSESSSVCGICGKPLQFLLQVYLGNPEKETAFHRSLFVFMCLSMSCLHQDQHEQRKHYIEKQSRSVKVFRCQLPLSNPFNANPNEFSGSTAPLCNWCGTWKGRKVCGGCKKARYCSKEHQTSHWRSGHKADCHQKGSSCGDGETSVGNKAASKTLWPEYEVIGGHESYFEPPEDGGQEDALVTRDGKDSSIQPVFNRFEGDREQRHWVSFLQCLSKAPAQVLRFSHNACAKPLWPMLKGQASDDDVPDCRYCGGPMTFEFQIMPQLLYYLGMENDVDSLDWVAVVVYTCGDSCGSNIVYKEEFAWVQLTE